MKYKEAILITALGAVTFNVVAPHGYTVLSLADHIAPMQQAEPADQEHDHQPIEGEGPTTLVGIAASGYFTNTTARLVTLTWPA
jgi:hypothetical protein